MTACSRQNQELQALNNNLIETNQKLEMSRKPHLRPPTGNSTSSHRITRHDIRNQLTGLLGYLELIREHVQDPETLVLVEKEERAAQNIVRQIEFTKNYEELGVNAPMWQDVAMSVNALKSTRAIRTGHDHDKTRRD